MSSHIAGQREKATIQRRETTLTAVIDAASAMHNGDTADDVRKIDNANLLLLRCFSDDLRWVVRQLAMRLAEKDVKKESKVDG